MKYSVAILKTAQELYAAEEKPPGPADPPWALLPEWITIKYVQKAMDQAAPCNSELLACPKCKCTDLETSPFPTTRHGDWEIRCGHPNCHFYLQSNDRQTLCTAWNLIPR